MRTYPLITKTTITRRVDINKMLRKKINKQKYWDLPSCTIQSNNFKKDLSDQNNIVQNVMFNIKQNKIMIQRLYARIYLDLINEENIPTICTNKFEKIFDTKKDMLLLIIKNGNTNNLKTLNKILENIIKEDKNVKIDVTNQITNFPIHIIEYCCSFLNKKDINRSVKFINRKICIACLSVMNKITITYVTIDTINNILIDKNVKLDHDDNTDILFPLENLTKKKMSITITSNIQVFKLMLEKLHNIKIDNQYLIPLNDKLQFTNGTLCIEKDNVSNLILINDNKKYMYNVLPYTNTTYLLINKKMICKLNKARILDMDLCNHSLVFLYEFAALREPKINLKKVILINKNTTYNHLVKFIRNSIFYVKSQNILIYDIICYHNFIEEYQYWPIDSEFFDKSLSSLFKYDRIKIMVFSIKKKEAQNEFLNYLYDFNPKKKVTIKTKKEIIDLTI